MSLRPCGILTWYCAIYCRQENRSAQRKTSWSKGENQQQSLVDMVTLKHSKYLLQVKGTYISSDFVRGVHAHVSIKRRSCEMPEERVAAMANEMYALASQCKIQLADAWSVDNKLSTIETIRELMMARALQECVSHFPQNRNIRYRAKRSIRRSHLSRYVTWSQFKCSKPLFTDEEHFGSKTACGLA